MAVDMKGLKEFVKLAKDSGASELVYETKTLKLKVNFGGTAPVMTHAAPAAVPPASVTAKASDAVKVAPAVDASVHVVKSPFVGTYYGSPAPGKPNYVKIGDKVKLGQPLCILEAMKIMNEIDSDMAGEIVEICVENESLVEYGQALFKIKRA
jgi:acetyl-CoA carboxylase biotin carboxyl carrier protein